MIDYVSNLPETLRSGGFSAMNAAASSAIKKLETTLYVGPVNPPVILSQKLISKSQRLLGFRGNFSFFSNRRLKVIAEAVHSKCHPSARLTFFHGFSPWILTKPHNAYVAWSDCTFRDYINIFHHRRQFCYEDLARIEAAEAAWLRNASRVLFTSNWAAERAVVDYNLDTGRVGSVGIFGEIEMPPCDRYVGAKEFAFVSTNFESKGGPRVLEAFRELRNLHPDATLAIVGDYPADVRSEAGVKFVGFLRKEVPEESRRFQEILGGACALVSATRCDVTPVLFVEAGYVGCPVISTRKFGIPELIDDGRTGFLLDGDPPIKSLVDAMNWMVSHPAEYAHMRRAAWYKAREKHTKAKFEKNLLAYLNEVLCENQFGIAK